MYEGNKLELAPGDRALFSWRIEEDFPEADFWLINMGKTKDLGRPTKKYQSFLTGIRCPAIVDPGFGYYLFLYLHGQHYWEKFATGSTSRKHLMLGDVRKVFNHVAEGCRRQKQKAIFTGEDIIMEFF